ncbi:hypothetical protein MVES1_000751 [Malassezia vespertilionis]|uniref:Fatty acid hydroxylase domain-containing protein n=1 Tax=Malassezia vespertilionis TaxID=2020962 RepID=A0A2N1JGL6_9BASI|nr:uncharacterized protein MVES1_000751 [Malassezia vespertilionis]PKI85679.1 hypothetical protein MVES_000707 [Malassezia vespertilionis]WFD05421.1 hypothetical protein MVES1_000751 [Malassezia vespertilionis]
MSSARNRPAPNVDGWKKERNLSILHRIVALVQLLPPSPEECHKPGPDDKLPVFDEWNQALYLLPFAMLPFTVRYLYYHYVDTQMPNHWTIFVMFFTYTIFFAAVFVNYLNRLALRYGYLDSGVGRDTIPYNMAAKIAVEAISALSLRPLGMVLLTYNPAEAPKLTIWFPFQLFIFTLVEDFYYYWFHRLCHEAESAWVFHRLHHTTKHPTALLLGYADEIQEVVDIVGAPLLSWFTFPIPYDVLSVWVLIHISIQLHGHSGIRLHYGTLLTGPWLRPLNLELVEEDHDLHHRHGWKDSYNYGKQSRVWDTLFGTTGNRIEGYEENLQRGTFIHP